MISAFRSLVQHNLAAKLLALGVAIVLWGYVMNDQNPSIEGSFTVSVRLVNAPEGYSVTKNLDTVKLKVRGPRSLFVANKADDFDVYADLEEAEPGRASYKLRVILPQGFELVSLSSETVDVTLDRYVTREVRADINVNGSPASGMTVASVSQEAENIVIDGPESAVSEVVRVIGYVGLTAKNDKDFAISVPLTAINADGREVAGVTLRQKEMSVKIQLARGLTKKIVSIKPQTDGKLPQGLLLTSLKTDPNKIEIAGAENAIANITAIDTEPVVLTDVTQNTDQTVRLVLPDGVTVTNHDVTVHIIVQPTGDK